MTELLTRAPRWWRAALAVAALAVLVLGDSWRTAAVAALAAAAVAATRVRFAALAALALVVVVALAVLAGGGFAGDERQRAPHAARAAGG